MQRELRSLSPFCDVYGSFQQSAGRRSAANLITNAVAVPQGLKPASFAVSRGTALKPCPDTNRTFSAACEAVPFPKTLRVIRHR